MNLPSRIISGGQTGVDQGALNFALRNGLECGGWCPPGRHCETGRIPDAYPLVEVESGDYNERTRRNVVDSDATLIITAGGRMEEGTVLTLEWAEAYGRAHYHLDLQDIDGPGASALLQVKAWLARAGIKVLNVAGNRESTSPGIGESTVRILEKIYGKPETL